MKVLVLAPEPFFQVRGTPLAVKALLEVLSSQGHQTTVLTFPGGSDITVPNCTVRRLPPILGPQPVGPGFSFRKLGYDVFMMLPLALASLFVERFDIVHAVEESVFIAAVGHMLTGVPYVYDMDSSLPQQMEERFPKLAPLSGLMARAEAFAVRHSTAVVAMSQALVDVARRYAPGKPAQCVQDFSLLESPCPQAERLQDVVGSSGPIVLYVGNLEPYQGIDLLLQAFARTVDRVPDSRLVVIGGVPKHVERYRSRAAALHLSRHVHLLGPRPSNLLGGYLSQATVLVSPRVKGQNTPMKIYSYLDSGTPLVATRLPTHIQVLDDTIALLAPPEAGAFGDAIVGLLEDPERRARLGAAAKRRVLKDFTREAFDKKMAAFYALVEREVRGERPSKAA
jgi:glycosyltransferase involved in cell wall biosynthesis